MTDPGKSAYARVINGNLHSMGDYFLSWGLCPMSILFGWAVALRSRLYQAGLMKSYRAGVPVISVGNLVAGGTGKTPMVDFLVKRLSIHKVRCAVVSRGYRGHYRQPVGRVSDPTGQLLMTPDSCGDEPFLLAKRNPGTPVYVARRRKLGVQAAERDGASVIVLDDGFQHLAVQRDVDIVLLDAKKPFANGHLLPAGGLREKRSALRRADLIIMTRADSGRLEAPPVSVPIISSRHLPERRLVTLEGQDIPVQECVGKSCLAFAGIARPEEFFKSLEALGFRHIERVPLADHQEYSAEILNRLRASCHNHDLLVTTEKDAVKLSAAKFPKPCGQIGIELVFDDLSPLDDLLDRLWEPAT